MFSTLQRFQADSLKEKIYGLMFYIFIVGIIGLSIFTMVYWESIPILTVCFITLTLVFLSTTLPAFASYGNYKNCHAGTVTQYIMKLNPPRPSFVHLLKIWDKKDCVTFTVAIFCIFTVIFTGVLIMGSFEKGRIDLFLLALLNIIFIVASYYISSYGLYKSKVSKELLADFYNIETISTEEKEKFKQYIIRILGHKGLVLKKDVFIFCKEHLKKEKKNQLDMKKIVTQKDYAGFADIPVTKN